MDANVLAEEIKTATGIDCALIWKIFYSGKKDQQEGDKVRALHIQLNAVGQQANFELLSSKYRQFNTSFANSRKLRFYPTWFPK